MHLARALEQFRGDVTFAGRPLRRSPAFTCVAALTLALGIGANSAIVALVDTTLLRLLPFHDPDRRSGLARYADRSGDRVARRMSRESDCKRPRIALVCVA